MRINCHAHIFNFRSVFTIHTMDVLLRRLIDEKWPDFLIEAAAKVIRKLLEGETLDEEKLLRSFVKELGLSDHFKDYLAGLGDGVPGDFGIILDGNIDGLAVGALRDMLGELNDLLAASGDIEHQTVDDFIAFLTLGFRASIDGVARRLMELSGDDTAVVPLMMDITKGGTEDAQLFEKQLDDTSAAALAFPGRILPFTAVNPLRTNHFELLERALSHKGCVGVKLYPSLGYPVDSPAMGKVYDYCAASGTPILMHCTRGGFYHSGAERDFSDPGLWHAILETRPDLRVCFGHFGGDENLTGAAIPPGSWTGAILGLMEKYPGVYADIGYHTAPMSGGDAEKNYFKNLGELLSRPVIRDRVLFGSDFFLVQMRLREDNLWDYFTEKFPADQFRRITEINPAAFLGLPDSAGNGAARNIVRYVDFLVSHKYEVGAEPPSWVQAQVAKTYSNPVRFVPNPFGLGWSVNNNAHYYTDQFFRTQMSEANRTNANFLQAGGLLVRELVDWPGEQVPREIRDQKFRMLASHLHLFMVKPADQGGPGAGPEAGVTRTVAENALRGLFANGDTRLADFGPVVDRLYRFGGEQ
jgi:predicted TIM-barrel fold metal-dependent hydrolase